MGSMSFWDKLYGLSTSHYFLERITMTSHTQSMSGFPEWLPSERMIEERLLAQITSVFRLYGFCPIETPAVERVSTLVAKGGNPKEIYKISRLYEIEGGSSEEADFALHFDLTVPMARYIAEHESNLVFPFRRYQMQPVWRGERPQAGRYRQFTQCDIDIVGRESLSLACDAEIPAIMASILRSFQIGDFQIRINNRKILQGFLSGLGIDVAHHQAVMGCVDKLEKIGREAVAKELETVLNKEGFDASLILDFLATDIALGHIDALRPLSSHEVYQVGVSELEEVVRTALFKGVQASELVVDLTIARGLDYYTGSVFETRLVEHPEVGSVCSGGRYEDLVGGFARGNFPGVGMSIGLTRLLSQLLRYQVLVPGAHSYAKLLIVALASDENIVSYAESLAGKLRGWNVACEVSLVGGSKVTKHIEYASKKGIPNVAFVGETELLQGTVAVKNLLARTQVDVAISDEAFFRGL
jgi:histidyl-tRNA synthetase